MSSEALDGFVERVARERNVDPMLVRAVVTDFVRELHERIYKDGGYGHALREIWLQVGEEAVYHFGGVLIESAGDDAGDFGGMVNESIARMGFRLSRYRTTPSTLSSAASTAARSCSGVTGRSGPFNLRTAASPLTPTRSASPSRFAVSR